MKKFLAVALLILMLFIIAVPAVADPALIEDMPVATAPTAEVVTAEPEPVPDPSGGPWTWAYLATIAGATAATLLIVQFLKVPMDRVWKIPTRVFVYIVALLILGTATAFTTEMNAETFLLCVLNAFVVALAAYGSYEITFAKARQ